MSKPGKDIANTDKGSKVPKSEPVTDNAALLTFDQLFDYKSILELFNEGVCIKNQDGVILYANRKYCDQLGFTQEELIGKSSDHLYLNEKELKIAMGKMELRKKGIEDTYENVMRKKDGSPLYVRVSGKPFFDAKKNFIGSIATHFDISRQKETEVELRMSKTELETAVEQRTIELSEANAALLNEVKERKQTQLALRHTEKNFRDIFDSSPDGIFVESLDGRIMDVNDEACKMHGYSREEMLKMSVEDLTPQSHLENVAIRQPLLAGGEMKTFEAQALHKDGSIIPIEVKVSKFKYNKKPALLLHVRDISDRLKSQQLLHKINVELENKVRERTRDLEVLNQNLQLSEQLYRHIARNIPRSAIFIFDNNMHYVLAEGDLIGTISLPREHIEGQSIYDLFTDEQAHDVENVYKWAIEGKSGSYDYELDGRIYQINYLPVKNDAAEIIYGMLMVVDITDLKKIQLELQKQASELKRSNEELERFAYVASHDLQGPLRTISSYLQLLESRHSNALSEDAKEFINYSVNGAKRLQRLIQDLLNYSRINSRPKPYNDVNLNDLLKVVVGNIQSNIDASGATVRIDTMPTLIGDSNQLMQLFQNLMDNGIKFIKDRKPVLHVFAIDQDTHWEFIIQDNGIGIAPEFREKIFHIFQRLHADTDFPGTGIGLAICKKIVHLHGGEIWFESEVDKGTTFHFTISKNLRKAQ
jgi:PAS domain S-box-containing protein